MKRKRGGKERKGEKIRQQDRRGEIRQLRFLAYEHYNGKRKDDRNAISCYDLS